MPGASSDGLRRKLLKSAYESRKLEKEKLLEYVERISREYPASAVVLFGSRARGSQLPYSDYDLAVVLPEVSDKIGTACRLRRIKPLGISVDLLVLEVNELEDPLIESMLEGGAILYDGLKLAERMEKARRKGPQGRRIDQ